MRFELTILGCNSAIPANHRFPTAQVLNIQDQLYLIDCGEGTQVRMMEYQVRKNRINQIFISHLHGDHVYGLIGLLTTLNLTGRRDKLQLFGPADLQEFIEAQMKYSQVVMDLELDFHVVDPEKHQLIFEDKVVEVYSLPLEHRIPCTGYLFREKARPRNIRPEAIKEHSLNVAEIEAVKRGEDVTKADGQVLSIDALTLPPYRARTYAYCSDTCYRRELIPLIRNVDLLYHETTFLHEKLEQAIKTKHTTALQAATIARDAEVGKLVMGHYSSRYKELEPLLKEATSVFPNSILGLEGRSFSIPLVRQTN